MTRADLRTAEVLLNYRASATRVELSSGLSAITAAFKKLNAPMAELLMKFGADPDAADGSGRTGRSLMKKNSKLQELVDRWDSDGAAAFEVCSDFELGHQPGCCKLAAFGLRIFQSQAWIA